MLPKSDRSWLTRARIPTSVLTDPTLAPLPSFEGLSEVDIQIQSGSIAWIGTTGTATIGEDDPVLDWQGGMVWPCFVDLHTHLDKGHIWNRAPNPDGTFASALTTVVADTPHWQAEDLYRRMEFGLKCSYAHGTRAIRTHLDSGHNRGNISWEVFDQLRSQWRDRLTLQAVSLVTLDFFLTPEGEALADQVADFQGILGGVAFFNPDIDRQLDRIFQLALERGLALDLHVDESLNPGDQSLYHVAQAALRHQFPYPIVCGHCCSLSVQSPEVVARTIASVQQAGIGIVSLPMCNLYLQGRQVHQTPRQRGVTLLHELKQQGVSVAIASDNCRDPFYGFGDHDGLEVFTMGVRIAHLDRPYGDWPQAITRTPADLMGLPHLGRIGVGLPADLILFRARNFSELLSRPQTDRLVLHGGQAIDTTLPSYAELDDLVPIEPVA